MYTAIIYRVEVFLLMNQLILCALIPSFFATTTTNFVRDIAPVSSIINSTLGHSDPLMSLGLNLQEVEDAADCSVQAVESLIALDEMKTALDTAIHIASLSHEEIRRSGWNPVHKSEIFALYKRRAKKPNGEGPVEYLLTGKFPDVSPRAFLHAQINKQCRKLWDKTMKDMAGEDRFIERGDDGSEDVLYYRTKWPWPLKDRDYILARRCRVFEDKKAIVLASKSMESSKHPTNSGVIRVDNYWCHSAFMSTPTTTTTTSRGGENEDMDNKVHTDDAQVSRELDENNKGTSMAAFDPPTTAGTKPRGASRMAKKGWRLKDSISAVDVPGMQFVTVFCDDQKVPLPPMVVDLLSKQGEKVVPDSIERLYHVAKDVERVVAMGLSDQPSSE